MFTLQKNKTENNRIWHVYRCVTFGGGGGGEVGRVEGEGFT